MRSLVHFKSTVTQAGENNYSTMVVQVRSNDLLFAPVIVVASSECSVTLSSCSAPHIQRFADCSISAMFSPTRIEVRKDSSPMTAR